MGKDTTKSTPAAPKKERTVLTPQQRVAKLEAELEAARKKAEERENKARNTAWEKRAKLVAKRDELTKQIDAIDAEFPPPAKDEAVEKDVA